MEIDDRRKPRGIQAILRHIQAIHINDIKSTLGEYFADVPALLSVVLRTAVTCHKMRLLAQSMDLLMPPGWDRWIRQYHDIFEYAPSQGIVEERSIALLTLA